jgi:hypothetical protein
MGYNGSRSPQLSQVNVKPLAMIVQYPQNITNQQFDTSGAPQLSSLVENKKQ